MSYKNLKYECYNCNNDACKCDGANKCGCKPEDTTCCCKK